MKRRTASAAAPEVGESEDDETLHALMNPQKMRSRKLENESSSELSSETARFRRNNFINGEEDDGDEEDDGEISSSPVAVAPKGRRRGGVAKIKRRAPVPQVSSSGSVEEEDDDEDDDEGEFDDDEEDDDEMPPPLSKVEMEVQKAVRKAKLLARIDQLKARGVMSSKEYTYRASEEELVTEVARMEVLAQRSVRIEQGRAVFISGVGGMEQLMNKSDEKEWLPFTWNMDGFTRATTRKITNYDDALERGVESMLGEAGSLPWYYELAMILIPAMVTHSMMQRFKDSPEHTNEVLRTNPQLREDVARELARGQQQATSAAQAAQPAAAQPAAAAAPSSSVATPPRMRMQAPPPPQAQASDMRENIQRNLEVSKQRLQIQEQNVRLGNLEEQLRIAREQAAKAQSDALLQAEARLAAERRAAEAAARAAAIEADPSTRRRGIRDIIEEDNSAHTLSASDGGDEEGEADGASSSSLSLNIE